MYDLKKVMTFSTLDQPEGHVSLWDDVSGQYRFDLIQPGDSAFFIHFAVRNPFPEEATLRFSTFFLDQVIVGHYDEDELITHPSVDGYLIRPESR